MAKIRRFHPLAAADISKAIAYYDDVSIDLGNRFRDSIRQRFESITEFPESYGKLRDRASCGNDQPFSIRDPVRTSRRSCRDSWRFSRGF